MVNPIDDRTPLQRSFQLDPQASPATIATIGDATALILAMDRSGSGDAPHWTLAFEALVDANDQPGDQSLLERATAMMADALKTAGMLEESRSASRAEMPEPGKVGRDRGQKIADKPSWFATLGLRRRPSV
jgi:hypothetical protein